MHSEGVFQKKVERARWHLSDYFIFIDAGNQCKSGLNEAYLSGGIDVALYKSDLYSERPFQPCIPDQVSRNRGENRQIPRDMNKETSFW